MIVCGKSSGLISIHALLAESDLRPPYFRGRQKISIHALLAESDAWLRLHKDVAQGFLSTLSLRRATVPAQHNRQHYRRFLSTLSLRRATGTQWGLAPMVWYFYPRSPCGERRLDVTIIGRTWDISIHALLAESDLVLIFLLGTLLRFLSTLSLRRATCKDQTRVD